MSEGGGGAADRPVSASPCFAASSARPCPVGVPPPLHPPLELPPTPTSAARVARHTAALIALAWKGQLRWARSMCPSRISPSHTSGVVNTPRRARPLSRSAGGTIGPHGGDFGVSMSSGPNGFWTHQTDRARAENRRGQYRWARSMCPSRISPSHTAGAVTNAPRARPLSRSAGGTIVSYGAISGSLLSMCSGR